MTQNEYIFTVSHTLPATFQLLNYSKENKVVEKQKYNKFCFDFYSVYFTHANWMIAHSQTQHLLDPHKNHYKLVFVIQLLWFI